MAQQKERKNIFTEWLEQLQQESWQLELLIAGFALFGISQARPEINAIVDFLRQNTFSNESLKYLMTALTFILSASWYIFFFNLLIHVILRGLWIGAIGLRYVSGSIDYESLNYSQYFTDYLNRKVGQFDPFIERLERLCSVIFAYTFLLFFLLLSVVLFFAELSILTQLLVSFKFNEGVVAFFSIVFFLLGFLVFIDFISLGGFKQIKNKTVAKIYGLIYRFYSRATLSFIYRPLLYNFLDNKYTRRFFWFSIPYMVLLFFVPQFHFHDKAFFPIFNNPEKVSAVYYEDQRILMDESLDGRKTRVNYISLESMELSGSHAKLFIPFLNSDDDLLKEKYEMTPFYKTGMFANENVAHRIQEDSILDFADDQKRIALDTMYKQKRAERKKKNAKDRFIDGMKKGSKDAGGKGKAFEDMDKWDIKRDSIITYWNAVKDSLKIDKVKKVKNKYLSLFELKVDGQLMNDQLSCKFYTHPYNKRKGLICYMPLDSLSLGEHNLQFIRQRYNKSRADLTNQITKNIPFWVIDK